MVAQDVIAVVGVSTPPGRAVLERLSRSPGDRRLLAVDVTPPSVPPGSVEVRTMDVRDRLLPLALADATTIVHCAFSDDIGASADALYGMNVSGTRNLLEAASKAGVSQLVVLSSATVYGAHGDNPVPLTESHVRRANPGFAYAYQRELVEEMVEEWAEAHPGVAVSLLRCAPLLGPGVDSALARLLQGPRLFLPAAAGTLWQFAHVDDVASAVEVVLRERASGAFNVASDGWLSTSELSGLLGRAVTQVGQTSYEEALRLGSEIGLSPAPPESLAYLEHPWVLDVSALHELGWQPAWTNREALVAFRDATAEYVALGRLRARRSDLRTAGLAFAALVALTAWRVWRR